MHRWLGTLCLLAALAIGLAACGKSSSTPSSSASSSSAPGSSGGASTASASSACGSVPTLHYTDKSGLIARLGHTYESQYNGYPAPILPSAWAHFKPHGKPPYTIGIAYQTVVDSYQAQVISMLQKEIRAIPGVGKVVLLSAPVTGVTTQLQQANSLIQQHVSVLVVEPAAPPTFVKVAAAAAKAGIPMISNSSAVASPYAINIVPNSVADGAIGAARLAKLIGGKGVVVGMHGLPATGLDQQEFAGFRAALKQCPGIKFDDSLVGQFTAAVAKQQMLSYLSTHPQPVAGVVQAGTMGSAIIQAFQQAGRPLPVMVDAGATVGDLVFWKSHPSKLASAFTITGNGMAGATAYTIAQLLHGHGPKITELAQPSLPIDSSNLSQFIPAGTKTSDVTGVLGPWLPTSYLAPLFNR